ncbi:unnamed protein product [Oikopleura dioica]|uniref:EGF-like domain-containing protein n=1 Tax=Oikopleura dioica TaxID=34765 RepID=E4XML2_OIKDI|nr:unnamed protein product [Oikopleura dioica]
MQKKSRYTVSRATDDSRRNLQNRPDPRLGSKRVCAKTRLELKNRAKSVVVEQFMLARSQKMVNQKSTLQRKLPQPSFHAAQKARLRCGLNSDCADTIKGPKCLCHAGYKWSDRSQSCEDVDECAEPISPCKGNSKCHNTKGSFFCECPAGLEGEYCHLDINECRRGNQVCDGKTSTCANSYGSYTCTCKDRFIYFLISFLICLGNLFYNLFAEPGNRTAFEKTQSTRKAATTLTNAKKEATAAGAAQSVSTFLAHTRASAQARFFTF